MVQDEGSQGAYLGFQVPKISSQFVRIGLVKVAGQGLDIQYGLLDRLGYWLGNWNYWGLLHVVLRLFDLTVRVEGELAHLVWMMSKSPSPESCYPDPAHTTRLPPMILVVFCLCSVAAGDAYKRHFHNPLPASLASL